MERDETHPHDCNCQFCQEAQDSNGCQNGPCERCTDDCPDRFADYEPDCEDNLSDVEADAMTLASAGWGTDEDYGDYDGGYYDE